MADNTTLNPGSGGDVIATDDLGTSKVQIVKPGFGADGSLTVVQNVQGSGLPVQPQVGDAVQQTFINVNDDLIVPCLGASQVVFGFGSNLTLSGATMTASVSVDGGTIYSGVTIQQGPGAGGINVAISALVQSVICAGCTHVRIRLTVTGGGQGTMIARAVYGAATNVSLIGGVLGALTGGVVPNTGVTNLGKAEDAVHTSGDVGVFALGVRNDGTTVLTSADGDYSPLATDGFGALYMRQRYSANVGNSYNQHRAISTASTNATSVKGSQGTVNSIMLANSHATLPRFFKLFNKATAPTVNTDTPTHTFAIPPLGNVIVPILPGFIPFATGIAYCIVDIMADTGQAAIAANEVTVSMGYA